MDPTGRPEPHALRRWAPFYFFLAVWTVAAPLVAADFRVAGSDLLAPALPEALAVFARQEDTPVQPDLRGTRPAVEELRAGRADLGLLLLPPGESPPAGFMSHIIGYQPAVLVVPESLPLRQVTTAQLRGIFGAEGNVTRWADAGVTGEYAPRLVRLLALSPRAGLALPLFRHVVLRDGELRAGIELCASHDELLARLRASDNGIGLTVAFPAAVAAKVRVLALADPERGTVVVPTAETLHDGSYPLRLPLVAVYRRADAARLLPLLKFLLGGEGAAALERAGLVPLPAAERARLGFTLEQLQ